MTERTKHPGRTPGRGTYETTIEDAETAAEAARLRSLGMTYRQIAAQQGVNHCPRPGRARSCSGPGGGRRDAPHC
jgi:hypothetical protein